MQDESAPCWIEMIDPEQATPDSREIYRQLEVIHGRAYNLYLASSLQPGPLISADRHYREILHGETNQTEAWFLELLATQVAIIADCEYATHYHGRQFCARLGDESRARAMLHAVEGDNFSDRSLFTPAQAALLGFGAKLSRTPESMSEQDIAGLRSAGITDTQILEAVQATACFAYWVRYINALGISRVGDPADDDQ